ncbi:hypothetical protein, partial [Stutzerimonas kunmingensis]|uniref:hypothetical protein n=1 Tax=Stutzerimonas kunmingensis TaxID=1211807 RepID=UPI0028A96360
KASFPIPAQRTCIAAQAAFKAGRVILAYGPCDPDAAPTNPVWTVRHHGRLGGLSLGQRCPP